MKRSYDIYTAIAWYYNITDREAYKLHRKMTDSEISYVVNKYREHMEDVIKDMEVLKCSMKY